MKLRTGVALVGLASAGVAAAVGYGLFHQVAPIFRPDQCVATVDGRTVTVDVEQAENAALRSRLEALGTDATQVVDLDDERVLQDVGVYRYHHPLENAAQRTA